MSSYLASLVVSAAVLTTGLTTGLLYAFAHTVMPGLGTLGDRDFLTGFQRMDAVVQNAWMLLGFLGSPVLTALSIVLSLGQGGPALVWLTVALVLIVATVGITATVHLPLNGAVRAAAPEFADASALRERFEHRWNTWNVARTVTSAAAFASLCGALASLPPAG